MRFLRLPPRRYRIGALVTLLAVAAIGTHPQYVYPMFLPVNRTEEEPSRRVFDVAGLLTPRARFYYEHMLGTVLDETGADVRVVLVDSAPAGDLAGYALRRMRELHVGQRVGGRGLLFVYDVAHRQMRMEVGPHLEEIFPDGFVGYLMRENTASFFADTAQELGLRLTLRLAQMRLRDAAMGRSYDPTPVLFVTDSVRLASGGGASVPGGAGVVSRGFIGRKSTPEEHAHFTAQPTVERAYRRYIEWLRDGNHQLDVELFTPETRTYLRQQTMTRAYNDAILLGEYGQPTRTIVRGARAMQFFTGTPFVSPHYYRLTPAGWQIDIHAEAVNTIETSGERWTWFIVDSEDDFSYAFKDVLDEYGNGWFRPKDEVGDNRELPLHSPR